MAELGDRQPKEHMGEEEDVMHRRRFLMGLGALAGAAFWSRPSHAEPLKQITLRVDGMT